MDIYFELEISNAFLLITAKVSFNASHFYSVPPKSLIIRDGKNNTVSGVIGPYEEGAQISLICEAAGGKWTWIVHKHERSVVIKDSYAIER